VIELINTQSIRLRTLGAFLSVARTEAKLTQKSVATSLGYSSAQFISNWERGLSQPPAGVIAKIVDLYRVDVEDYIYALSVFHTEIAKEESRFIRKEVLGSNQNEEN